MGDIFTIRPNAFMIAFEASDENEQTSIQNRILKAVFIRSWWNQIPNVYVLESDLDAPDFFKSVNELFPVETYLMGQLSGSYGGRMSFEKWKHLINASPETIRRLEVYTTEETERRKRLAKQPSDS